jgi:hypothetical protein
LRSCGGDDDNPLSDGYVFTLMTVKTSISPVYMRSTTCPSSLSTTAQRYIPHEYNSTIHTLSASSPVMWGMRRDVTGR